jgi:hypothetical protein
MNCPYKGFRLRIFNFYQMSIENRCKYEIEKSRIPHFTPLREANSYLYSKRLEAGLFYHPNNQVQSLW